MTLQNQRVPSQMTWLLPTSLSYTAAHSYLQHSTKNISDDSEIFTDYTLQRIKLRLFCFCLHRPTHSQPVMQSCSMRGQLESREAGYHQARCWGFFRHVWFEESVRLPSCVAWSACALTRHVCWQSMCVDKAYVLTRHVCWQGMCVSCRYLQENSLDELPPDSFEGLSSLQGL